MCLFVRVSSPFLLSAAISTAPLELHDVAFAEIILKRKVATGICGF